MAKGKKKEKTEEAAGSVPDIPVFRQKNNSPQLVIPPAKLQTIMEYFDCGSEFETIALECHKDYIQIIVNNNTNNIMAHYVGRPPDTKVGSEGYFILEPKKILQIISKKYKNSERLYLTWEDNDKFRITDDKRNPITIALKSITTISKNIPPLDRRFIYKDRKLQFNKKMVVEGKLITVVKNDEIVTEDAETSVLISQSELMKASNDIEIAGVDYVIVNFSENGSYFESGTWNEKGDTSRTDEVECEVKGSDLNKALPKEFITVLKKLSGDINIQGTQTKPVIGLSQFLGKDDMLQEMHYNIMENKKRES